MPQRTGLGRGLDALIPGGEPSPMGGSGASKVALDLIERNPRQPRIHFDADELDELSASIREHGIIQPLIVSPGQAGKYVLIAGERRLEAARKAGLANVPVVVREASDQQFLELALIENVQRADLNAIEEAEAYLHLTEEFGLSHEQVALRVGKNRVTVTNTLRLLNLSDKVKQSLVDGQVSEGHARALLGLSTLEAQDAALQTVLNLGLNVRQTELLVRKLGGGKTASKPKAAPSPEAAELEQRLRSSLGTKVSLRHGRKGGTLTIHYYSNEELDALLGRLLDE